MKYSLGLLGLAAIAAASDVVDLGKDTFEDFTKENSLVLAECMLRSRKAPRTVQLTNVSSLCALVWSLQGSRSRV
jgi:hypothetical protein